MSSAGSTVLEDGGSRRILSIWIAPVAALVALWLWLAFSSGGYIAHQWLPPSLALGLFGLVISLLGTYPRRPRQLSLAVLTLFACYSAWVALSALWAASTNRVWLESGRTFTYLLIFALAVVLFTDQGARKAFRYLLMAAGLVLLTVAVCRLWSGGAVIALFDGHRFAFPVTYPNNAAALYLVFFWPLMWLASGPEERALVRGIALGLATGLLGLAVMTQSRGAIWSLVISMVVMFVVSPGRLRALLYLLVPALLMVYAFPNLNRYWLEGPSAVGGELGARTLVVASVTAAFIGMILALLERWVTVSRTMKVIFGTVVLLGALGAAIYGSITLTADVGGPFKWVSHTWHQLTTEGKEEDASRPESTGTFRFAVVSSSGRAGVWRVGWQSFEGAPLLGVGADNYVFQHSLLRTTETYKPQQAHSLVLQVLGETGIIGGIFAFGGMLLGLGGLLWPRSAAGWQGVRTAWSKRRTQAGHDDTLAETDGHPRNPRWGSVSVRYGWEMAIFAGLVYWIIHASVDWVWQMSGVSIPALLLLAAGVAAVDARVGMLWPRWNRRLRLRSGASDLDMADTAAPEPLGDDTLEPGSAVFEIRQPIEPEEQPAGVTRGGDFLHSPGVISPVFRTLLVTLSLLVIISAGFPYLALKYQESALALARTDGAGAVKRAGAAHWLLPTDPEPYEKQAMIYSKAALAAVVLNAEDRAGAVFDNLALCIERLEMASMVEPADWSIRYHAGVAAINLLLAEQYAAGRSLQLDYSVLTPKIPGLQDWSMLTRSDAAAPDSGIAAGSLAVDEATRTTATYYRSSSPLELAQLASMYLESARERNPLESQITSAVGMLQQIQSAVDATN